MPDLNPALQAGVPTHTERLAQVRELLAELSRREVLALAASTPPSNRFGWANLGPTPDSPRTSRTFSTTGVRHTERAAADDEPADSAGPASPSPSQIDPQRRGWRRRSLAASSEGQQRQSAGSVVTELGSREPIDKSPLEIEFDDQVRALLVRIDAQELQARAAQPDVGTVRTWPSWSMDTGLTQAQETFVEAWSPVRRGVGCNHLIPEIPSDSSETR